ncbi:hypothetical protein CWO85_00480 [Candidatus Phytoplasma ziziphi]|uniref:Uncharacterized protein n=1 Tax=Ziziphus jujuba witches'-broom phytoplasma TaxID=135727 RepID=A0A660HLV0_ZIZJU|nr:hypothetical protein CWO85_00480 [Candidatus Phytoplasma ziziphi]
MKKKINSKKDKKSNKEQIKHPFIKQQNMSWKSRIFFFCLILILALPSIIIFVIEIWKYIKKH